MNDWEQVTTHRVTRSIETGADADPTGGVITQLSADGVQHEETVVHVRGGVPASGGEWRGTITLGPRTSCRVSVEGEDEPTVRAAAQRLEDVITRA